MKSGVATRWTKRNETLSVTRAVVVAAGSADREAVAPGHCLPVNRVPDGRAGPGKFLQACGPQRDTSARTNVQSPRQMRASAPIRMSGGSAPLALAALRAQAKRRPRRFPPGLRRWIRSLGMSVPHYPLRPRASFRRSRKARCRSGRTTHRCSALAQSHLTAGKQCHGLRLDAD